MTGRLEVYRRKDRRWAWRLVATNGQVVAVDGAQGYSRRIDCLDMARSILAGSYRETSSTTIDHSVPAPAGQPNKERTMTWNAKFKVQDISDGPSPLNVLAVATIEDGSLVQNTEKATSMELRVVIDADETAIKVGDEISGSGHFCS